MQSLRFLFFTDIYLSFFLCVIASGLRKYKLGLEFANCTSLVAKCLRILKTCNQCLIKLPAQTLLWMELYLISMLWMRASPPKLMTEYFSAPIRLGKWIVEPSDKVTTNSAGVNSIEICERTKSEKNKVNIKI